ncbi:MAG: hypothetical protein JW936_02005 [Sedimentisphaerales bacterium]|nr:hypothetical protein [Sedimentisphaerales bacterium]
MDENLTALPQLPAGWIDPAAEFSLCPFWFWNDKLDEREICRQIDEFYEHGVYGFVIHPRLGLPSDTGWMSGRLLKMMRSAIEYAAKKGMWVVLYDEGMYPSGSSAGQVVAENPEYAVRGLYPRELTSQQEEPVLEAGENLLAVVPRANGQRLAVIDRPADGFIRGLHYIGDVDQPRRSDKSTPPEEHPPAADLLNPNAVQCFLDKVYCRYFQEFGQYFGKTIKAIFTDEPNLLGRRRQDDRARPGTTDILEHVQQYLGYDFTPHLPALWYDDEPDASLHRRNYDRAVRNRLEATYYEPLGRFCQDHNIALTGHPAESDEIAPLRYFQWPGQDMVWRQVQPRHRSILAGPHATMAKCSSSAMVHAGCRRNVNECFGAYGPKLSEEEMKFLTNWLIVRGVNLIVPHAFYYSVRGPRIDESPRDVGMHSPWWSTYRQYADTIRRLCWLNTDSRCLCSVAILTEGDALPWKAAKILQENQIDFHYLEIRDLLTRARVYEHGIELSGMRYTALVTEQSVSPDKMPPGFSYFVEAGRLIYFDPADSSDSCSYPEGFLESILAQVEPAVQFPKAQPDLRVRCILKDDEHWCLIHNEGDHSIQTTFTIANMASPVCVDHVTLKQTPVPSEQGLCFEPGQIVVLRQHN